MNKVLGIQDDGSINIKILNSSTFLQNSTQTQPLEGKSSNFTELSSGSEANNHSES